MILESIHHRHSIIDIDLARDHVEAVCGFGELEALGRYVQDVEMNSAIIFNSRTELEKMRTER